MLFVKAKLPRAFSPILCYTGFHERIFIKPFTAFFLSPGYPNHVRDLYHVRPAGGSFRGAQLQGQL